MKSLICAVAVLVAVATALPQHPPQANHQQSFHPAQAAQPVQPQPAQPAHRGVAQPTAQPALPASFFGPGLNNPRAFPPNPHQIEAAKQVASANPNIRVRVLANGEVEFTDQFGLEIDVVDRFGRDPLDLFDPEEMFEFEAEQRERNFKRQQHMREIELQQQLLSQFSQRHSNAVQHGPLGPQPANHRFRIVV